MLKTIGTFALALLVSLGVYSIGEASDNSQNQFCCRGGYCYNGNFNRDNRQNDRYCGDYCCDDQYGCRR